MPSELVLPLVVKEADFNSEDPLLLRGNVGHPVLHLRVSSLAHPFQISDVSRELKQYPTERNRNVMDGCLHLLKYTMKILTKLCIKYTYNVEDDDPWSQKLPVVDPKYNCDR